MASFRQELGPLGLLIFAIAACHGATPPRDEAGPTAVPGLDPGFLEVRAVEASGPPPQDPSRPRPQPEVAASSPRDDQGGLDRLLTAGSSAEARAVPVQPAAEDPNSTEVRLRAARLELEREQARRLEVERERDGLAQRTKDLEARILSLTLERTRLEQEVLQLRIDALRAELAAAGPAPAGR